MAEDPPTETTGIASTTSTSTTTTTAPLASPALSVLGVMDRLLDKTQPFALPEGTVRAFAFMVILWALIHFYNMIDPATGKPLAWAPPELVTAFQLMLGYYVGARQTSPATTATVVKLLPFVLLALLAHAAVAVLR
ncbi:hypothetical protein EPO05_06050 [Patescibacteria group bacterium]|nr:MAG: hypothetical protein EPO05_06050 [Patescibacteria group bacterium]